MSENDVPVELTMNDNMSSCAYQCGLCCGECILLDNFLDVNNCKCNFTNCTGFLGNLLWFISLATSFFGILFLGCDKGRVSTKMGSCNFLWLTVAPSIFTFLMAASIASIGTFLLLIAGLLIIWKKLGPSICRRVCRCNNFAHGLEQE